MSREKETRIERLEDAAGRESDIAEALIEGRSKPFRHTLAELLQLARNDRTGFWKQMLDARRRATPLV